METRRHGSRVDALLYLWRGFLDSLATDGGYIFVLFTLVLIGIRVYAGLDATAGGQIITLSFGALIALLKPKGSNREQMGSTTTVAATTTTTEPPPAFPPPPVAPDPPLT
jgi:hypothetical protein